MDAISSEIVAYIAFGWFLSIFPVIAILILVGESRAFVLFVHGKVQSKARKCSKTQSRRGESNHDRERRWKQTLKIETL